MSTLFFTIQEEISVIITQLPFTLLAHSVTQVLIKCESLTILRICYSWATNLKLSKFSSLEAHSIYFNKCLETRISHVFILYIL